MSMYDEKLALYRAYMMELDGFRSVPAFKNDDEFAKILEIFDKLN